MNTKYDKTRSSGKNRSGMICAICGGKIRRLGKEEIEKLRLIIPNTGVCTVCNEMQILHRLSETSIFATAFGGKLPPEEEK